jgi:hypothetical protein
LFTDQAAECEFVNFSFFEMKTFPVLAFALLSIVSSSFSQSNGEIPRMKESLANVVRRASENQIKRGSDGFRMPTAGQLQAWQSITKSILGGRPTDARQTIKRFSFPYAISLFTDSESKREYYLLEERIPLQTGWGLYVFDRTAMNPSCHRDSASRLRRQHRIPGTPSRVLK